MATTIATQVQQLYVGLLGRAADQGGLNWWVDQVTTGGKTIEDIRASFVTSTEYTTTYGAAATRADLVTSIYQNLFERTPSADEVKYWAQTDTRPADQLVAAFLEFASANDQKVIDNKVFVANTYTSTVGDTNFDKGGAASIIANVDGTTASVTAALTAINDGTVAGQVPGQGLIANIVAAQAELVALEKAVFATNPTYDGTADTDTSGANVKDGLVTEAEARDVLADAQGVRGAITGTTADLTKASSNAASNLAKAKALVDVSSAEVKANVATYDAAIAAQKALVGDTQATSTQTAAEVAEDKAGNAADTALTAADSALKAAGAPTTYAKLATASGLTIATQADLETALETATGAAKSALIAELQKLPTYGQKAIDTVAAHKAIVDANDAADAAAGLSFGTTGYLTAATTAASTADTLAKAQAADVAVSAAQDVVAKYTAVDDKLLLANTALDTFKAANTDKVTIHDDLATHGTAALPGDALSAKADVFYFSTVNTSATANDFTLGGATKATQFGASDSIVLGSGYTFNSGALAAGDNSKLEFFLVQKGSDTLVVIETANFGSANTLHTATSDTAPVTSPDAAVITLTGVNVADLTVNNGVISHVA